MSYKIDRLDDFGRGITKVDGKVCFVNNALKDEEVEINVINEKNKFIEGITSSIIKESKERIIPKCPYYNECGGCNIMHMTYQSQLDFKREKVNKILSKFAGIDNKVKDIIPSKEFNYRNKVTLKVNNGKLCYLKEKSSDFVYINECILLKESINKVIKELNEISLNNIDEVVIRCNYKDEILLVLKGNNVDVKELESISFIENIVIFDNNKKTILKGNDYLIDRIGDKYFKVTDVSFFQVNIDTTSKLYNKVLEYSKLSKEENVLDLYCGTGTIGIFLSDKAKSVIGVEINEYAVKDAEYNSKLNNSNNTEFICSDVAKIKEKYKDIDLVVLDPPRMGLSSEALNNVIDINPKRIVYVSCDPITLSRDINILKEKYDVKEVTLVDMFPNTYHCESITVLERR